MFVVHRISTQTLAAGYAALLQVHVLRSADSYIKLFC